MMGRLVLLLLISILAACREPQPPPGNRPSAAGPQVRATVLTIRTTVQPENQTFTSTIVIAGDRARNMGEQETWRLYDTKANTVTFVDDLEKTVRTEAVPSLVRKRADALHGPLPAHFTLARLTRTKQRMPLQGISAEQLLITSGAYRRELWIGEHPAVPKGLFAMSHASEPLTSPLAPMMRAVDEALVTTQGFPLLDRTEVPSLEGNVVVERTVTGIVQQQIAESAVAVPKGYRDITPKAAPPAKKK